MNSKKRWQWMSAITNFKTMSSAFDVVSRLALPVVFSAALVPGIAAGPNSFGPPTIDPPIPGEPGPRASVDRSGTLTTRDGLTLHLTTDVGSVHIVALEAGAI